MALALAGCGGPKEPAVIENVVAHTKVGDIGALMVEAIEITVSNHKSIKGLTAADFDLVNNSPDGFTDPTTGGQLKAHEDDQSLLMGTAPERLFRRYSNGLACKADVRSGQKKKSHGFYLNRGSFLLVHSDYLELREIIWLCLIILFRLLVIVHI